MGVSDEARFVKILKAMPEQCAGIEQLGEILRTLDGGAKWTDERVRAKVKELNDDPASAVFLGRRGVHYFGAEHLRNSGLYEMVKAGAPRWGKDNGYGTVAVEVFGRVPSKWEHGSWACPDMVLTATRRTDALQPTQLHVVEVERAGAFDVPSIYQAYEQARGADFAWVFFATTPKNWPNPRLGAIAKELGVGLVAMERPNWPSQWKVERRARQQTPTRAERAGLHKRLHDARGGSDGNTA